MRVRKRERMSVWERERESVCERERGKSVCERERERECVCVCVCVVGRRRGRQRERERESGIVCVCLCVRETESKTERERKRSILFSIVVRRRHFGVKMFVKVRVNRQRPPLNKNRHFCGKKHKKYDYEFTTTTLQLYLNSMSAT